MRKSRDLYERYARSVKPWAPSLWHQWIGVHTGQTIVDVGCGTGYFTRFLARGLKGRGKVVGVDNREVSLKAATKATKQQKLSSLVEYKLGEATNLPLPDNHADVVACRTLLMHLKDPSKGIREMRRVAKPGGVVAAVEADFHMRTFFSPKGEDRSSRENLVSEAWVRGLRKLDGKDFTIGSKLPTLFVKEGLADIQLNLDSDAWLNCDPRRSLRDKMVEVKFSLSRYLDFKDDSKYLRAGGMSTRGIEAYRRQKAQDLRKLVDDPKKLARDTTVYAACWFIATGRKP